MRQVSKLSLLIVVAITLLVTSGTFGASNQDASGETRRSRYIEFSDEERWSLESQGHYHCRHDRRDLYCMYHLWTTSATGDHATLTTTVTMPVDWAPPYGLEFYCSDDYLVRPEDQTAKGWLACHAYPGHRFKQVLVNDRVVWEADVADEGTGQCYGIDVTDHVQVGEPFELAIQVIDRVGMAVKLAKEFWYPGTYEPKEDHRRFMTHVYWGDLLVTERFNPARLQAPRESPSITRMRELLAEGKLPRGPQSSAQPPIKLTLEAPRGIAARYPFSCGIPVPQGIVRNAGQLCLTDAHGRDLAAQFDGISQWQDGSVRWALASVTMPTDARPGDQWTLSWESEPVSHAVQGVRVEQDGEDLMVSNQLISVRVPQAGQLAIEEVTGADGRRLAGGLSGYLLVKPETRGIPFEPAPQQRSVFSYDDCIRYRAQWDERVVLTEGPRRVTVELRGHLKSNEDVLGRCIFRFSVADDSPLVRVWYRVFNDTQRYLKVREMTLTQEVEPGATRGQTATIEEPDGWHAIDSDNGTVFAAVRWTAEMPIKVLELDGDALAVRLFRGTRNTPYYRPRSGEARRHELLLGYYSDIPTAEQLSMVAACCQRPPRLWNPQWACETGALGYGRVRDESDFPRLTALMRRSYGDLDRRAVKQDNYDIRDFGDRYHGGGNTWCNNYYEASRGFIAEYLMTGNANAFDRAEEQVLHQIDIDQCHWHPDANMAGALWSYNATDHSNAGEVWPPLLRAAAGWCYYYRMTGDPDARAALFDLADYVLSGHNVGFTSIRAHNGPLTALVWAYDESGDDRYLQGAFETMADTHTRMSRRRGCYMEPNGNAVYWVTIPWMASEMIDVLYHLWRLSGDVEAAATALGLAESIIAENGVWGAPGEIGGSSGNPHFGISSSNYIIIAPAIGLGYELTRDAEFLLWARACFERAMAEKSAPTITGNYWLTPALLYLLHQYRDVATRMPAPPPVRVPPNRDDQ